MSKKRFMITGIEKGCYRIGNVKDIRKDTGLLGSVKLSELTGESCILDMLNQLNNENEQLRQRYYALKKENDRLENNIIDLNEANDFRKKNLKIMELSDTEHNLKMLLASSDEQTERFIKGLQDENRELRQQLQEMKSDEKLYAQEILELNKTKKEMLNFRNLGSDY